MLLFVGLSGSGNVAGRTLSRVLVALCLLAQMMMLFTINSHIKKIQEPYSGLAKSSPNLDQIRVLELSPQPFLNWQIPVGLVSRDKFSRILGFWLKSRFR